MSLAGPLLALVSVPVRVGPELVGPVLVGPEPESRPAPVPAPVFVPVLVLVLVGPELDVSPPTPAP